MHFELRHIKYTARNSLICVTLFHFYLIFVPAVSGNVPRMLNACIVEILKCIVYMHKCIFDARDSIHAR